MLNKIKRVAAGGVLILAGALAGPTPASADGVITGCTGFAALQSGCSSGTVTITVTTGGQTSSVALTSGGQPVCTYQGGQIPCSSNGGWWSASRGCYVSAMDPQPATTDPQWQALAQGQTGGKIYQCILPSGVAGPNIPFWSGTPPVSTPQVIALVGKATQSLNLRAIDVGMAPTPTSIDPSSIGIVGLPNWLWVKTPTAQTWGPATGTASAPGVTVTVTAHVDKVTWDMGDGTAPIICTGPGTPYIASYGNKSSPTCGHTPGYQKQGTYPVTAVSHWTITYTSSVGVSGTLTMDLTSTASVTIGELQTTVVR